MQRFIETSARWSGVLALGAVVMTAAAAQSGGAIWNLSWHSTDGGGGPSAGGPFALVGAIGQPDAGGLLSGGAFALQGGFIAGLGSAPGLPCAADIDGDGAVAVSDLLAVLGDWDATGSPADIDGNGVVGVGDLLMVLGGWGACP
jgi:hypothetical protein